MQVPADIQKLPVLPTLVRAWGTVPRNLGIMARLYWPWLAIVLVALLAWGAGIVLNSGFATPSPALATGAGVVPLSIVIIALLLSAPAVFVGWHRAIQLGERPAQPIRLDATVWAYFGYGLLIGVALALSLGLIVLLVTVAAGITTGLGEGPMSLERLAALRPFLPLALIPYYVLLSRFSLVLPAIAVGQRMSLVDSFRLTRGNTWRLTIGAGLVYLPVAILSGITEVLGVAFPDSPAIIGTASLLVVIATVYCLHAALSFGTHALERLGSEPAPAAA